MNNFYRNRAKIRGFKTIKQGATKLGLAKSALLKVIAPAKSLPYLLEVLELCRKFFQ